MRKFFLFIFSLAVAVMPLGNAAFATKTFGPKYKVVLSANAEKDSATATAQVKLDRGHDKYRPVKAIGFFDFTLYQGSKKVDKKTVRTTGDDKTTKATVKFEGLKSGSYKIVATFKGDIKAWNGETIKIKDYIKTDKWFKIEAPQEEPQEPQDPGNGGGDDDGKGGDDDGDDSGDDNGQQPGGDGNNGQSGDNGGSNDGKDGNSGTIQNPGSGGAPATGGKLPKTATNLPLNAMLGGLLVLAGGAILLARRLVA